MLDSEPPVANGTRSQNGAIANGTESAPAEPKFHMLDQWHSQPRKLRIIHVGAGATGLCAAWEMERQLENYELVCYEKNNEVGGTWLENRYPGCACDVPAHIYTYTFEPNPKWSTYYAYSEEINAYFKGFCDKHGLRKYIKFQHRVTKAEWVEEKGQWRVEVAHNGDTLVDWCHILVNGSGLLNKWKWPDINGLTSFKGKLLHSAAWDDTLDRAGKRVAVLGNGSSAIQIIPQAQKTASQIVCFMRGSTWISAPMPRVSVDVDDASEPTGKSSPPENSEIDARNFGQYTYKPKEIERLSSDPDYLLNILMCRGILNS